MNFTGWCPRTESNRALRSTKPVRRQLRFEGKWSGWRDSNPRFPRWQRGALPLSHTRKWSSTRESNRARRFQGPRCAPALPTMWRSRWDPPPLGPGLQSGASFASASGSQMDGERGIEPRPTRSERDVLPLHQSPTIGPSGSTRTTGLPRIRRVLHQLSYARMMAGRRRIELRSAD